MPRLISVLLLAIFAFFPIFQHLGLWPLKLWDESLFACRALYMAENGEYMFNFNQLEGGLNMPSMKPPLVTILQALCFKIFGYNVFALRLPIALAVIATGVLMIRFCKKNFQNPTWGYLSVMVLLCTNGYIHEHMARTGDHEAFLVLFTFWAFTAFYRYVDQQLELRYLWETVLALYLAFLVKSMMAFFFLPGFFLYLLYKKQVKAVFSNKSVYLVALSFIAAIVAYFLLMNAFSPSYAQNSLIFENWHRYTKEITEQHVHPFSYYFYLLWEERFIYWINFLPLAIILVFLEKTKQFRDLAWLILSCGLIYLCIISFSNTKLVWYDACVYPFLALLVGLFLQQLLQACQVHLIGKDRPTLI